MNTKIAKITEDMTSIERTFKGNYIVNAECEIMPYVENSWKVQVWTPIYLNGIFLHRTPKTIGFKLSRLQAQKIFNKQCTVAEGE